MPDYAVSHDAAHSQFHTDVDGQRAVVDYRLSGDVMTVTHTLVPSALEGRGIAAALTAAALAEARAKGWKVVPGCSYTAGYMRRHPETQDLLATQ